MCCHCFNYLSVYPAAVFRLSQQLYYRPRELAASTTQLGSALTACIEEASCLVLEKWN